VYKDLDADFFIFDPSELTDLISFKYGKKEIEYHPNKIRKGNIKIMKIAILADFGIDYLAHNAATLRRGNQVRSSGMGHLFVYLHSFRMQF
jgi:hypothetical protein